MRKLLFLMIAAVTAVAAANEVDDLNVDDINLTEHTLSFSQIEREWHDHHFFTVDRGEKPGIKALLFSFAMAYPNDLINNIIAAVAGLDTGLFIGNYVFDERNGYVSAEFMTELTCSFQMCYWHRTDGDLLIAVALQGDEYKWEGNKELWEKMADNEDEDPTVCVNDLMFFKLEKGEVMWLPKTPRQILGRDIDFKRCRVELPRNGKDIRITHDPYGDRPVTETLRWNGRDFRR